jgi:menaquinone-dependent protoporphyrinogen IX oxidase
MKSIILYKGKYGATQQYAEWLAAELHLPAMAPEKLAEGDLNANDLIIIGSSVYVGRLLISDWLKQYAGILKNKKPVLFVVCGSNNPKEQEKIIKQNIPEGLIDPSCIFFLPGRLLKSKLSWKDRLLLRMGAMVAKDPETKKLMLQDRDNVKKENLSGVISKSEALLAADDIAS